MEKAKTNCDHCSNFIYNVDYQCYECEVNLDEDELAKFMSAAFDNCPYFRINDEYKTVRKQI